MGFIVIVGCDGSGKSAVISELADHYQRKGVRFTTGHWRPELMKRENGSLASTADDPHAQTPRSPLPSFVKLVWIWLNWWGAWIRDLRQAAKSGIVLFDRFHGDLTIDPIRYRYGGPRWVAAIWTKCLPSPDLVVFLDADVETLLSRKQEVERAELENLRARYTLFARNISGGTIVDASRPLADVVHEVIDLIDSSACTTKKGNATVDNGSSSNSNPHR